jgi:DNA-3-methyladenine glycosylase II
MIRNPHNFLIKTDPVLGAVIKRLGIIEQHKRSTNHFRALVESIVSQQLSVKASDTIFKRFLKLFPGRGFPTPAMVLKMPSHKMRACGLSNSKVSFIKDLAEKIYRKELNLRQLQKWENEEVILHLTQVKGIGRWTAEMFLMFSLQRPDVFSHGDLGLRNAVKKLYGFKKLPSPKQIEKIVQKWSPHKTLASRYLWRSLDNK